MVAVRHRSAITEAVRSGCSCRCDALLRLVLRVVLLEPTCCHSGVVLSRSMFMGNIELPGGATGSKQTIKMPVGTYEFGANLLSEKGVRALQLQC